MSSDKFDSSKPLGNWGIMSTVQGNERVHITQTNKDAFVGEGAHVTTKIGGNSYRDYFDKNGNFIDSDY